MCAIKIDLPLLKDVNSRRNIKLTLVHFDVKSLSFASVLAEAHFKPTIFDIKRSFSYPPPDHTLLKSYSLYQRFLQGIKEGKIKVEHKKDCLKDNELYFIFTPIQIDSKGDVDYRDFERSCKFVGDSLEEGSMIAISTRTFPGTTEDLANNILEDRSGLKANEDFGLAYIYLPSDMRTPVISAANETTLNFFLSFFQIITGYKPSVTRSIKTVEALSFIEDLYKNVRLAFSNDLAEICRKMSVNFNEIIQLITSRELCCPPPEMPKESLIDVTTLFVKELQNHGWKAPVIASSLKVNSSLSKHILSLIRSGLKECNKSLRRSEVLILRSHSDLLFHSIVESHVKDLFEMLRTKRVKVQLFDFHSLKAESKSKVKRRLYKSLKGKDCLIIMENCKDILDLNSLIKDIKHLLNQPALIVDLTNQLDPLEVEKEGLRYISLGWSCRSE